MVLTLCVRDRNDVGRLDRYRGLRLRGGVHEYVLEWTFRVSLPLCSVGAVPTCRRSASFGLISFFLIMSRDSRCAGGVPFYRLTLVACPRADLAGWRKPPLFDKDACARMYAYL